MSAAWEMHEGNLYCQGCGHGEQAHADGGCVGARGRYWDFSRRKLWPPTGEKRSDVTDRRAPQADHGPDLYCLCPAVPRLRESS